MYRDGCDGVDRASSLNERMREFACVSALLPIFSPHLLVLVHVFLWRSVFNPLGRVQFTPTLTFIT